MVSGCGPEPSEIAGEPPLPVGFWHAGITLPGGEIDAGIEISRKDERYSASLINGPERVVIREVSYKDGLLLLRFPAFNSEIRARIVNGKLVGELILVKSKGATQSMPFVATAGAQRSDPASGSSVHDLSGRWAVQFHEADGSNTASVGEFSQRGSRLFGTFLNASGDYRYLTGFVRNNSFNLSTFDGAHAFLFSGTIDGNKITNADFWSGTSWHQTWSAARNTNAKLPDPYQLTHPKPGYERFEFAFPDLDGKTVSLDNERFAGKVVVVTLAGSWCPNSHDEARFMAPLYEKYRSKGLEVVALMYEHFDDPTLAGEQVTLFREKFNIAYTTLIAGTSSKSEAAETLPSLDAVHAFPTTIFIDRSGRVRKIHTGFSGPGTGEHYKVLTTEMTSLIETLLAEPAEPSSTTAAIKPGA